MDDLTQIVDRNVHVCRIREPKAYEPTDRMLTTTADSQRVLYRDADITMFLDYINQQRTGHRSFMLVNF